MARSDKSFDAVARLDELLVARGETGAHVARPVLAERGAGHDGDFFLFEQTDGEFFFRAPSFRKGAIFSALGVLLLCLGGVISYRKRN